jgi:hypothetical protein
MVVTMFLNFGFSIDAGFPFDINVEETTGWNGPYNLIFAQNSSALVPTPTLIDQYVSRYVTTLSTPYLRMDAYSNVSLFQPADFDTILGPKAINSTIHAQTKVEPGTDAYGKFLGTCDNGNLQPVLPMIGTKFSNLKSSKDEPRSNNKAEEMLDIDVEFKILSIPDKSDNLYSQFPSLQKKFNEKKRNFHISGPYCYGDDPKRAFTFDFSFSSSRPREGISLVRGCVANLPCLPPHVASSTGGAQNITWYNHTFVPAEGSNDITNAMLFFACYFLLFALIISLTCNCQLSNKMKTLQASRPFHARPLARQTPTRVDHASSPYGDMEQVEDLPGRIAQEEGSQTALEQPLLRQRRNQPPEPSDPPPTNNVTRSDPEEA